MDEFVWRRERNFNVTMDILADMESGAASNVAYFYVSLVKGAYQGGIVIMRFGFNAA